MGDRVLQVPAWAAWATLAVVVLGMVAVDLRLHHGRGPDSRRRAIAWSAVWIGVAVLFGGAVWLFMGARAGSEFFSAWLLEKSLSVDNLFVFLLVFGRLGVPSSQRRRVLTWGILGALVTRGLFIAAGTAVLARWQPVVYFFGALLLFTAWKTLRDPAAEPRQPAWVEGLVTRLPWTPVISGERFLLRRKGRLLATPLLLALVVIEVSDVAFALDSIPAALAVTSSTFVVYSSNVLAVLGLRSLFVVLGDALAGLEHLRYGLAAVLAVAGLKMIASPFFDLPAGWALGIIAACIGASVASSLWVRRSRSTALREAAKPPAQQAPLPP